MIRTSTLEPAPASRMAGVLLFAVCLVSLVLTTAVNNAAGRALDFIAPGTSWLARTALPSALVALALYLAIRPARPLAEPAANTPWRAVFRVSFWWLFAWVLCAVAYALLRGEWRAYVAGGAAIVAFVALGPLGEELLFRGTIFELAQRQFPTSTWAPVILSTVLFSAHHLQLHGFHVTPFVVLQLAFTLPMGLVFARLRVMSGSIWPSFVVHLLTNLPHAFGLPPAAVI
jgi:membrane protease YdiL (CAAX protease family)